MVWAGISPSRHHQPSANYDPDVPWDPEHIKPEQISLQYKHLSILLVLQRETKQRIMLYKKSVPLSS